MRRPDQQPLEILSLRSLDSTTETPLTTSRMVDWSIVLDLTADDEDTVADAFNKISDNAQSLNQSLSYIKNTPLLVDIELKKTNAVPDPLVQLAIWKAGGFKKMQLHGWDTSMPMPGITVNGHLWECYIFFARGSRLVSALFSPKHSFLFRLDTYALTLTLLSRL